MRAIFDVHLDVQPLVATKLIHYIRPTANLESLATICRSGGTISGMKPLRKRRFWQFGLSTLLLGTVVCGAAAWLFSALVVEPHGREQALIAEIRREGGRVDTEALGPAWLDWIHSSYRQRAVTVHLVGPAVDDALLGRLKRLEHLRKLWLVETSITFEASHALQSVRPDLEIHVVQGFPVQTTEGVVR
jgi:hypothetical protein